MFKSRVFEHAITHRFELTKVLRQSETDKMFIAAVNDLRVGNCTRETADFIKQLSRELEPQVAKDAIHIFFKEKRCLTFQPISP